MSFKPNFPFKLFCPMENLRLSMFLWILGAKRSLWTTPKILETKSPKNINPPNAGAYSKPLTRRFRRQGTSKRTAKFNQRGLWMVVFHFPVLPNMACPSTLS